MKEPTRKLKILFAPLNAWGHISSCSVIGKYLKEKYNHEIIFLVNSAWKDKLIPYGFAEEVYTRNTEVSGKTPSTSPMQYWTELVCRMEPLMKLSSLEKVKTFGLRTYDDMVSEIMESNQQIETIVHRVNPDIIVIDNYIISPALLKFSKNRNIPWVRLRSASPAEINQANIPPQNSGLAICNGDPKQWAEFFKAQEDAFSPLWQKFNKWFIDYFPNFVLPKGHFIIDSPFSNLYLYPEEIDYVDLRPMPPKWIRIDALINTCNENQTFQLPEEFTMAHTNEKIIYINLGTFGSADLNLMKNVVHILSTLPYKFIICKGPFHEELQLSKNMWGESILPQTSVLPVVDAVICHGANATMNECFYFGKPMIAMPFFGDEYDNAQRLQETGYGVRLNPYALTKDNLSEAISFILWDPDLTARMECASRKIQSSSGVKTAAQSILATLT